ncbi:MAG TPA: hypothetical protein VGI43_11245 [Mucilaginibacter sp.]
MQEAILLLLLIGSFRINNDFAASSAILTEEVSFILPQTSLMSHCWAQQTGAHRHKP